MDTTIIVAIIGVAGGIIVALINRAKSPGPAAGSQGIGTSTATLSQRRWKRGAVAVGIMAVLLIVVTVSSLPHEGADGTDAPKTSDPSNLPASVSKAPGAPVPPTPLMQYMMELMELSSSDCPALPKEDTLQWREAYKCTMDRTLELHFFAFDDVEDLNKLDPRELMHNEERQQNVDKKITLAEVKPTGDWSGDDGRKGTYVKYFEGSDSSRIGKIWLRQEDRLDVMIVSWSWGSMSQESESWERGFSLLKSKYFRFD